MNVVVYITYISFACVCAFAGAHQGQRDGVGGRGGLLSRLECNRLDCQRGERAPFDSPAGANDAAQHDGHPASARDPERAHDNFGHNAGDCRSAPTKPTNTKKN